ncbi:MAG: glycosyltransferase family 39 protein [Chloroflexi bacterium]|nr:glycosyltransferase family 39 protein [Chloroflexota bacterium]
MRQSLTLGFILLLAFLVRIARLDFQPLWWDEGYSLFFATRDFVTMLERTAIDIHPPLYYAFLQGWIALAGKSDIAVRLMSVAIGVAAIPLLYALARELFDDDLVANGAALILALSPLHVYYSQEVRMYGMVTLFGLASMYLFVRLLHMPTGRPRTGLFAMGYALATAAALYTQYYAAFILALQVLVILVLFVRRSPRVTRRSIPHWFGAWIAIALLYAPWVWFAGEKLYTYVSGKVTHEAYAPLTPLAFAMNHLTAFSVGHLSQLKWLDAASAIFIAFGILGIVDAIRHAHVIETDAETSEILETSTVSTEEIHDQTDEVLETPRVYSAEIAWAWDLYTWIALAYLVVPVLCVFFVNLIFPFHPIRSERLLLIVVPAFCLLIALGVRALWERRAWVGALALALTVIASLASLYDFYTVPRYAQDDYRPLIAQLQTHAQPGDTFLAIYPWQIGYLETYYAPRGAPLNIVETPNDAWIENPAQMQSDLDALLTKNPRVWVPALQTLGRLVEDALDANLRPRTYLVVDEWFGTTRLELFARAEPPMMVGNSIAFEDNVHLIDRGVSTDPVAAGQDMVRVDLVWGNITSTDLRASLRLVDPNGNTWMQDDRDVTQGTHRIGFSVDTGTPPGTYALQLRLYRARDGSVLRPDHLALGAIQVTAPAQSNLAAIPQRVNADFANGARLVGSTLPEKPIRPGDPTSLALFWQAPRAIAQDFNVAIQIEDERGNVYASTQAAPARGIYPATRWQIGELVRDPQSFTLRGDTPDGAYRVTVTIAEGDARRWVEVGKIAVKNRPHYFGAPSPSQKFSARIGEVAQLVGYDISQNERAVRVVLYWQALSSPSTSYTAFAQLLDSSGALRAQRDQIPGAGAYPTTSWVKGEYLVDVYDITLQSDAPPGEYTIIIGMYDTTNNTRLPVFDATQKPVGDHSELSTRIIIR